MISRYASKSSNYSPRFQFQFLSVVVWASAIVLVCLLRGMPQVRSFGHFSAYMIGGLHLIPWLCALRLWQEARDSSETVLAGKEVQAVILLLMWNIYIPLIVAENLYWFILNK